MILGKIREKYVLLELICIC